MTKLRIVDFSGNFSRPSRTRGLVKAVLGEISLRGLGETQLFDLVDVGPEFSGAYRRADLSAQAKTVATAIEEADAIVVGSAIYKGAYSGLFKHFFDLFEPVALTGKPVILTATGGSSRHALVIETHLRPLFSFFNVVSAPAGIFATETDFNGYDEIKENLFARIDEAIGQFARLLPAANPALPLSRIA
ncbi:MAG TPA: NAD(P)H-dependent oxidoreductase [Terriglobia bacterium]|nr:NAD(P)H-dependent oxidoreductase [Terriglobia bacterium]